MDSNYKTLLAGLSPFAEQFIFGGQQSSDEGYVEDREQNNELNGSGSNDPSAAHRVYTTLTDWLFKSPANADTPAASAAAPSTQVKQASIPWLWVAVAVIVGYLLLRRR